jgi:hypothetical protein
MAGPRGVSMPVAIIHVSEENKNRKEKKHALTIHKRKAESKRKPLSCEKRGVKHARYAGEVKRWSYIGVFSLLPQISFPPIHLW